MALCVFWCEENDDDDRIKGDLFWLCYGFCNLATYVHDSDCTLSQKFGSNFFLQF